MAHEKWRDAFWAGRGGYQKEHADWYARHFVEWISEFGYHIELTGDEFESYAITDKVS